MGALDCRAWVLSSARLAGFPAVELRRGTVPAGEAAWREFVSTATYFELGYAERALAALCEALPVGNVT